MKVLEIKGVKIIGEIFDPYNRLGGIEINLTKEELNNLWFALTEESEDVLLLNYNQKIIDKYVEKTGLTEDKLRSLLC